MENQSRALAALGIALLGLFAVGWGVFVAQRVLLGLLVGTALLVAAAWAQYGALGDRERLRRAATWTVVAGVVAYGVLVAHEPLLAVLVAAVVYLVSWLTGPRGPWGGAGSRSRGPGDGER